MGDGSWGKSNGKWCVCEECGRGYIYHSDHRSRQGHGLKHCNSCIVRRARIKLKQKAVALFGGKCSACGYDKCLAALEFHHPDKALKTERIKNFNMYSWEVLKGKLRGCVLLCANCHREAEGSEGLRRLANAGTFSQRKEKLEARG